MCEPLPATGTTLVKVPRDAFYRALADAAGCEPLPADAHVETVLQRLYVRDGEIGFVINTNAIQDVPSAFLGEWPKSAGAAQ